MTPIVLAVGVALRTYSFLRQPSLWTDEIALLQNIITRSPRQLVASPLAFGQVAPAGYLLLEKALIGVFGNTPLVTRAPSVVASCLALFVIWRIANRLGPLTSFAVVAIVAFGPMDIAVGAQLKQYAVDMALSAAVVLVALRLLEKPADSRRVAAAALVGTLAALMSTHAVLTVVAVGVALIIVTCTERQHVSVTNLVCVIGIWAATSGVAILIASRSLSADTWSYMRAYWASGFLPHTLVPWKDSGLVWLESQVERVYSAYAGRQWNAGSVVTEYFALLAAIGICTTWRTRRDIGLIVLCCLGVTLTASWAGRYPFTPFAGGRLILFESALLVLLSAHAIEYLGSWLGESNKMVRAATVGIGVLFALPPAFLVARIRPPYYHDLAEEMLEYAAKHQRAGDAFYASYGFALDMLYYAPRIGISEANVTLGSCATNPRVWLSEVDKLRGKRVWVFVANGNNEDELLDKYLRTLGSRVDSIRIDAPGNWMTRVNSAGRLGLSDGMGVLYDLRQSQHLPAVSPATYPIPDDLQLLPGSWWCYGVFDPKSPRNSQPRRQVSVLEHPASEPTPTR